MILCCGEATIDMIPASTIDGGMAFVPHAGGAVFNTAIALGRLGGIGDLFVCGPTGTNVNDFRAILVL
jgi:sugar/nucleoside kinase (ribokinase family)